jgi:prephenate dehydratase
MQIGTFFLNNFMKIAIQGIRGSYHHEVATDIFGKNINLVECDNFSELPPLVQNKKVDKAVMAIENTIAGAILPNYALIDEYNLQICGEYYLPIQHQLMGLTDNLNSIKEVRSHPMALEQCRKFFRNYPAIKLIEEKDTALVAKNIQQNQLNGIAAIASKSAAKIYDLNIIASDIQTNKANYTRFVIIAKKNGNTPDDFNKASIKFRLNHHTGSLLEVLQVFYDNNLNMSKYNHYL